MYRGDDEPDDASDVLGDPPEQAADPTVRVWIHPSEVGHSRRQHVDRRRGTLLAVGLVGVAGIVLLGAATLAARSSPPPSDTAMATGRTDGSLARIEDVEHPDHVPVTGVVFNRGHHVVAPLSALVPDGAGSIDREWRVQLAGELYSPAVVVASDPVEDLAVMRLDNPHGSDPRLDTRTEPIDNLTLIRYAENGTKWSRRVRLNSLDASTVRSNGSVADGLLEVTGVRATSGVLANDSGELVGWVMGSDGDSLMAYPAREVMTHARELLLAGRVPHSWIGVKATNGSGGPRGAQVLGVEPGGPAALAGVAAGDVIVSIDGERVDGLDALVDLMHRLDPGAVITLGINRGGAVHELQVTVTDFPT